MFPCRSENGTVTMSIGQFLGGALFFAAVAATASLWSTQLSLVDAMIFGAAMGGSLALPLSTRFPGERQRVERGSASGPPGFLANVFTGIKIARARGVLFGIPCSVAVSVAVSAALAFAAGVLDGRIVGSEFVTRLNVGFWVCGLYVHSVLIVAAISVVCQSAIYWSLVRFSKKRKMLAEP